MPDRKNVRSRVNVTLVPDTIGTVRSLISSPALPYSLKPGSAPQFEQVWVVAR